MRGNGVLDVGMENSRVPSDTINESVVMLRIWSLLLFLGILIELENHLSLAQSIRYVG